MTHVRIRDGSCRMKDAKMQSQRPTRIILWSSISLLVTGASHLFKWAFRARAVAKRDEAEGGDEYTFVPPDFDEEAFIHREVVGFRAGLVVCAWGLVCALLSWAIFAAMDGTKTAWLLGLLLLVGF